MAEVQPHFTNSNETDGVSSTYIPSEELRDFINQQYSHSGGTGNRVVNALAYNALHPSMSYAKNIADIKLGIDAEPVLVDEDGNRFFHSGYLRLAAENHEKVRKFGPTGARRVLHFLEVLD